MHPVAEQPEQLAQQEQEQVLVVELEQQGLQPRERLVELVPQLQVQHRTHQSNQDVHRQEQLYQLQHRSLEVFLQLVMESLYQPYRLKLLAKLHQLQLNLQHS